jgi:hypothetical protein
VTVDRGRFLAEAPEARHSLAQPVRAGLKRQENGEHRRCGTLVSNWAEKQNAPTGRRGAKCSPTKKKCVLGRNRDALFYGTYSTRVVTHLLRKKLVKMQIGLTAWDARR